MLKKRKRHARRVFHQVPVGQYVLYRKLEGGGFLIGRKGPRHGQQQCLLCVEVVLVDRVRKGGIVYHKVQRAVEQLVDELGCIGFYEMYFYERILLGKSCDDRGRM